MKEYETEMDYLILPIRESLEEKVKELVQEGLFLPSALGQGKRVTLHIGVCACVYMRARACVRVHRVREEIGSQSQRHRSKPWQWR